jgi:hypothetical protein
MIGGRWKNMAGQTGIMKRLKMNILGKKITLDLNWPGT